MATRFRYFDWSATPIGPPEQWPESWRNAVRIILDSSFPTALGFGPELVYFYNDAFIPLGGPARHPSALGLPVQIAWKEIWDQILLPRFSYTLKTGEPTGEADLLMPLERSGYLEETFVTFSFAALRDDHNRPNGIFCTAIETTGRIIAERQINCLRALAARSSFAETPEGACQSAVATLEDNPRDLPFALLYLLDPTGHRAHLAGTSGLASVPDTVPAVIELAADDGPWQLARVASGRTPALVEDVQPLIRSVIRTPEVTPGRALALPISSPGSERLAGILIAGVNPMRPLDEARAFHQLVASQLETAISNARAKQHVRERAQALAELDRAKTVFFSNISHELRTPLTLLLSPLDEVLGGANLDEGDRDLLQIARRGGGRLLKLVNSLLEFSRIESGRMEAAYEPTDLATLTADLASVFRSAFERAGVILTIDCPALPEPVFVDRDMWEKIVLNLISNALKFTFSGEVQVRQHVLSEHVQLEVADTGCGVPPDELPRLFERFFRGRAAQGRTHEGSGIGLSLVQELVKLHVGSVEAHSQVGSGTTITVRIPRGVAHLPSDRIGSTPTLARARIGARPFVEEALGWLPGTPHGPAAGTTASTSDRDARPAAGGKAEEIRARLLVVDDNADMRGYLCRLLGDRWQVEAASDGAVALERVHEIGPDLIIADVMMPGVDGFALLRALREDAGTAEIPVMLLTARAGEESSAEGLRAGADDYVIKPFSARELLARVEARLAQARVRAAERHAREVAERANRARDEFFATLSHELRTPLMAVLAWAGLLRGHRLDSQEAAEAVDLIERNARIQRRLVDDLLDVSRIVTDRLRIESRPIPSLEPVIDMVVESFRPVALAKGIILEAVLDSDAGTVRGDAERLQQVVWNLLSNAIRFTPAGGRIEIRYARSTADVELSVRDSGRGIGPDALPHLFERYWQGRDGPQPAQGLGLGLAIARRIVELHSGSIAAASQGEGFGATFTVRLPVVPESEDPTQSGIAAASTDFDPAAFANARMLDAVTAAAALHVTSASGSPEAADAAKVVGVGPNIETVLRILLVEDHDGIAKACQRLLASHGHIVVRASGLAGAVTAAHCTPFDVVICDLSLPDGNGLDLLPRIRSCFKRTNAKDNLPAIAISGRVYEDDITRCLAAGFAAHLAKPFDEQGLLAALREATRG
jgi:signal transduction histidine kinase